MTSQPALTRAFATRLDRCCRHRGKTLDDVAREVSTILGRRVRPEKLPTCVERPDWVPLSTTLAEVLDVGPGWFVFGEGSAPSWWGAD